MSDFISVLELIFRDFWTWLGTFIMLYLILYVIEYLIHLIVALPHDIITIIVNKKKERKDNKDDKDN